MKLAVAVGASIAIQLALPHLGSVGSALNVPEMPFSHCLTLLSIGAIPLVALEMLKVFRRRRHES